MKYKDCPHSSMAGVFLLALILITQSAISQTQDIRFQDFSAFQNPGKNWELVGSISADLEESNVLDTKRGTGILVNRAESGKGKDLLTERKYGDFDLEVDYLMAKGSNSGIYFLGQYELQLRDSWGTQPVTSAENGGIYVRWDEKRPEGQKGYQGYAPRQNVSKAPGLWQHLEVSFQAPRFNEKGEKTENAKFIYVKLNGVTIHEDVELFGPTRGSLFPEERARGPLRIQGDHGAVAFRDLKITSFDKPRPELKNIEYKIYSGKYDEEVGYENLSPESEGKSVVLTSNLSTESDQFFIVYSGNLLVEEPGEYSFNLGVAGGKGLIRINGNEIIPLSNRNGEGTAILPAGEMPFELIYSKVQDWVDPGLGLIVSGVGIREYVISDGGGDSDDPVDPILVEANSPVVFRSFMDIPIEGSRGDSRLTHAVSVGNPLEIHYTYDLNNGTIVQMWRGDFLDATPMWYSRGNGTSRPMGSVLHLGGPQKTILKLDSKNQEWAKDTTGANFRTLGYSIDEHNLPTFSYTIFGTKILDQPRVMEEAQGIQRTISVDKPVDNLYVRLAKGKNIKRISNDLYLVGDMHYYLQLNDLGQEKPILRENDGNEELLVPIRKTLTYSYLF